MPWHQGRLNLTKEFGGFSSLSSWNSHAPVCRLAENSPNQGRSWAGGRLLLVGHTEGSEKDHGFRRQTDCQFRGRRRITCYAPVVAGGTWAGVRLGWRGDLRKEVGESWGLGWGWGGGWGVESREVWHAQTAGLWLTTHCHAGFRSFCAIERVGLFSLWSICKCFYRCKLLLCWAPKTLCSSTSQCQMQHCTNSWFWDPKWSWFCPMFFVLFCFCCFCCSGYRGCFLLLLLFPKCREDQWSVRLDGLILSPCPLVDQKRGQSESPPKEMSLQSPPSPSFWW